MKNNLYYIALYSAIIAANCNLAFAQTNLQQQLEAVSQVHENNVRYEKEQTAKAAARLAKKRLEQQKAAKAKQDAINEKIAREQAFKDELRAMEVEERRLELTAKKAKVNRVNDYIDQELKAQAAQTDVVQSNADAMRNVSSGTKDYLQSTGRANEVSAAKDAVTTIKLYK